MIENYADKLKKIITNIYDETSLPLNIDSNTKTIADDSLRVVSSVLQCFPETQNIIPYGIYIGDLNLSKIKIFDYPIQMGDQEFLEINIRYIEFLNDILAFFDNPSYEMFITTFCKYIQPFAYGSGGKEEVGFYRWLSSRHGEENTGKRDGRNSLITELFFLILHEIAHEIEQFRDVWKTVLELVDEHLDFGEESDHERTETLCDISSVYIMKSREILRNFNENPEKVLVFAVITLSAHNLYDLLTRFTINNINNSIKGDSKLSIGYLSNTAQQIIMGRVTNLLLPIAKYVSADLVFNKREINNALEAMKKILFIFDYLKRYIDELPRYVKEYEQVELKEEYTMRKSSILFTLDEM